MFRNGRQARVERSKCVASIGRLTALQLVEPSEGWDFVSRIELAESVDEVSLFIRLEAGATGFAPPSRPTPNFPKCGRELMAIARWTVQGTPVTTNVVEFRDGRSAGSQLAGMILSPSRRLPILAVSQDTTRPLPPGLASNLARETVGLATVVSLDPETAFALTDRVGQRLSCFHGGLRLYWPRVDQRTDPFAHPLWTWERLVSSAPSAAEAADRITAQLKRMLMEQSVEVIRRPAVFDVIRETAIREAFDSRIKEAVSQSDFKALAEDYAKDNDRLRKENSALRDQLDRLRTDLENERSMRAVPNEEFAPETEYPPGTPTEAVVRAKERFESTLVFGADVFIGVKRLAGTAGPPDKVFWHLEQLAVLADARRQGPLGKDPVQWLNGRGAITSGEGERVENNKTERQARTWDRGDGSRGVFLLHTKPNDSTSPDKCVRIYFDWCEKRQKYVVGWVGPHPL